jgi:predicted metalloprotease with PDZ domain
MFTMLLATVAVFAADTVRYEIAFPNRDHHEAQVSVTFPAEGHDTLEIRMSRSSPGRYALHEFAKNVYAVSVTDAEGRPLVVDRPDPYRWRVSGHQGVVRFRYTLFADRADGTYSQFDAWHAHMNMPATFAWAAGLEGQPVAIRFIPPPESGWRVATQLVPTADPFRFAAPDLAYFMDSPALMARLGVREWTVASAGRLDTIRLAMQHRGTDAELDAYATKAKAVVAEQVAIFGETARYDHGTYTFLATYMPQASGDGMEHRNSTVLSSSGSLARNEMQLLSTLGHEFFHSWNVERIRPAALEPFDFFRANASDALWFAEGFTSYYTPLPIRRAGLMTDAEYAASIGGTINAVVNAPGRRFFSPLEMSLQAPFVDAATSVDPVNRANTFLSYYTWGAAIGLGLDLSIRARFPGKDLDGYFRVLWTRHGAGGRYAVPRPYTVDDLERALGDYTGNAGFAEDFFLRFVHGQDVPDYATLLAPAGFVVRPRSGGGTLGAVPLAFDSTGATVQGSTLVGTPLHDAGVDAGDRLHGVNGIPVRSLAAWRQVTATLQPGDTARIAFTKRAQGDQRIVTVTAVADPALEVIPLETTGAALTPAQRAFRAAWLGSRVAR